MGIDVSIYQGKVDWPSVRAAGNAFAFARATVGRHYVDSTFATNWHGMKSAGVIRGAYHYYIANLDPTDQANHFVDVLKSGQFGDNDLPPVLDLEDRKGAAEIGPAALITNVHTWLTTVSKATGRIPIIYTDPDFWRAHMNNQFCDYFLWIANYGVPAPHIPSGWHDWTFWQYTSTGTVNGIHGPVDQDHFKGGPDGLSAFIASSFVHRVA